MRTPVGSGQQLGPAQVPTVPEIEETIQEENPPHPSEKIYVAVGKDLSESVNGLKWALLNLDKRQVALVILIQIHLPLRYMSSPMGNIPLNRVSKDVLKKLNNCLKKYLNICTRSKVKGELLIVDKDEVSKGILEVVSEQGITKLIKGTTSSGGAISKKMKMRAPGKADYVRRHAIDYCDVSTMCKGKLVLLSEGSPLHYADSPQMDLDEAYTGRNMEPEPLGSQEASKDTQTLKHQLREALQVAENAKKEMQSENAKRKKAEAAAMKLTYKVKDLEAVLKEAVKEKEDTIFHSRLIEQKYQDIRMRRNEVEEELQEMVENLTSRAINVNHLSRERQEARNELEAARQRLAALEEQNHRILQEKDSEIKHLQNCLLSRTLIETPTTSSSSNSLEFSEYSLDDINGATCYFSEHLKLGEGDYGTVYKGEIGQASVAVKIPGEDSLQGRQEFQREINILREIRHPHLVSIVGACSSYEYMANGSLADRLICRNGSPPLPWHARIRIATEVFFALQFLHSFKPDPILHHDLKPENILLDENYVSKLSDFGLSRLVPQDLNTQSEPQSTFSYIDPEYVTSGEYSTKSDVYSLGIVILQLLTRKPSLGLVKEVKTVLESGNLVQVLDPSAGEWPFVQATQLADLALRYTEPVRKNRPDLTPAMMKMMEQLRNFAVGASYPSKSIHRGKKGVQAPEEKHVPSFFLCPIFKEVMQDPYVATDGFTYEKDAIQGWFDYGRDTSPMTNKKLDRKNLVANHSLRSAIREWQQRGDLF